MLQDTDDEKELVTNVTASVGVKHLIQIIKWQRDSASHRNIIRIKQTFIPKLAYLVKL
ncbi:hypothetical protein [Agarilytica rhodophyticola]|uniref:hypothetical protein n=1 Tax=Agarilytica rhodophyticola TaxID=1737490 RepID=UPI0013155EC1|nr:hypothetical protein [Agarilytica rhodophyticola]